MSKVYINKEILILFIIVILIVGFFLYSSLNEKTKENEKLSEEIDIIQENSENFVPTTISNNVVNDINKSPQQINALDRVFNPLRYPYRSSAFYNQYWRSNLALPPQVIGCGGRNTPCLGGSQVPIANPMIPLNVNNNNIAPINIRTRGPLGEPQQVGTLYHVYGRSNEVLPLFGRRRYPNGQNNWEYYTTVGPQQVKLRVVTRRRGEELGTNDVVFIKGYNRRPYRVTIYESDFPQYIPYL